MWESGSIWQKVSGKKWGEDTRGVLEMYSMDICVNVWCLTPLRAALAWNSVRSLYNLSCFSALCFQLFPPVTPFVSEWDDNLVCWSHLKNHGSLISLQCCSAALPPTEPQWKLPMRRHQLKCTMHMHARTQTNTCLITSATLPQSNSSEGWWFPKKAQNYRQIALFWCGVVIIFAPNYIFSHGGCVILVRKSKLFS